ncbi:MAG: hypothetical protein JRN71_05730 [Nitrososphaerota archaeon]|jgi:predicted hydrocarbon binding protein|nr:hypothetical protein [Nitrososphaerota archaeon]MDG6987250.1 hypothetical protein [Nitrososphaerota archaeon]
MTGEEGLGPKDVIAVLYDPGKTFFHVVVTMKNEPGALADVAKKVSSAGINVLGGFTRASPQEPTGVWSFFAEPQGEGQDSEKVRRAIESSKYCERVDVNTSRSGLLVDSYHFPIRYNPGERAVMISPATLRLIFDRLISWFGTGGEAIVYEMGRTAGLYGGQRMISLMGMEAYGALRAEMVGIYAAVGWGKVTLVEEGEDREVYRVSGSFECAGVESAKPKAQFMRGAIAGFVQARKEGVPKCVETKCEAMGESFCEFVVESKRHAGS